MQTDPLMSFKSHIGGKNADVTVFSDRIEWQLNSMSAGSKLALGVATAGLSLAKTGISGASKGSEIIPVKSISSVTTKKDGIRFTKVSVICSGNTVDFRVAHNEANPIRDLLMQLILGSHPSQGTASPLPQSPLPPPPAQVAPPPPTPGPTDSSLGVQTPAARIAAVKDLYDQGLISQQDFDAKRQAILDSI